MSDIQDKLEGLVKGLEFCLENVEHLSSCLQKYEDSEIDDAIAKAVSLRDNIQFNLLVVSALHAGRPVDSVHFHEGLALIEDPDLLYAIASKLKGDTGGDFLTAVELNKAYQDIQAVALVCASWWYLNNLGKLPERLVAEMRIFKRRSDNNYLIVPVLGLFSEILNRNGYKDIISAEAAGIDDNDSFQYYYNVCRRKYESPVIDTVQEKPYIPFQLNTTVKRSVPKIGRNEPCHCGSGKKYKHCCLNSDKKRLKDSSEVAGFTKNELRENPDAALSYKRISKMSRYELLRIDISAVKSDQIRFQVINTLLLLKEFEHLTAYFEKYGVDKKNEQLYIQSIMDCSEMAYKPLLKRLYAIPTRPDLRKKIIAAELILDERDDPILADLEDRAKTALKKKEYYFINETEIALSLMKAGYSGLGIIMARGALLTASDYDLSILVEKVNDTRDRLSIFSEDPAEDYLFQRWSDNDDTDEIWDNNDDQVLWQEIEDKKMELSSLRRELAQVKTELNRKEKLEQKQAEKSRENSIENDTKSTELHARIHVLKSKLREHHTERIRLRDQLEKVKNDLNNSCKTSTDINKSKNQPISDEMNDLVDVSGTNQPVRLSILPETFQRTLSRFPTSVARHTMRSIGKLCAGDIDIFKDVKKLRERNLYTLRIGISYRLLFYVKESCIEIRDLIDRKDFEKELRNLN
ncbi:MAG: SEC-C metal-binding domain-containing protein [Chitinispirillia bacterium]|jgi:hypothetical protein